MITQTYNLNLIPGGVPVRVPVSQYDAGSRDIIFNLYSGSAAFSVPAGATVTVDGTKPDRKGFSYTATASGNIVTVTVTEQMTAVPGNVECQLTVMQSGKVLGSANFLLAVERAALPDGADLSATEINSVVTASNQAAAAAQAAQAAVDTLDSKKAALEASTSAANTAKTNLTSATSAANTARNNLTSATSAANTAKSNLTSATSTANTARTNLTNTTSAANAAKTSLDAANETAEANLAALNDAAAMAQKIPKVTSATAGHLAALKADGTLSDSGKSLSDLFQTPVQQGSGNADNMGAGIYWVNPSIVSNLPLSEYGFVITYGSPASVQEFYPISGGRCTRINFDGGSGPAWTAWEWSDCPGAAGVEYRTAERFRGKPVYTKIIDTEMSVNGKTITTGISNVIRYAGTIGSLPIPYLETGGFTSGYAAWVSVNDGYLTLNINGFAPAQTYIQLWYTKY